MTEINTIEKTTFQNTKHLQFADFRGAPLQFVYLQTLAQVGRFVIVNLKEISWNNIYFHQYM